MARAKQLLTPKSQRQAKPIALLQKVSATKWAAVVTDHTNLYHFDLCTKRGENYIHSREYWQCIFHLFLAEIKVVHRGVHIVVWQGHHRWPQHPVLFHDLGPGYARVLQPMGWMNLPSMHSRSSSGVKPPCVHCGFSWTEIHQHALELPLSGEAFLHCGLSSRTKKFCTNLLDLSENEAPPIPMYYHPFSYKNCHFMGVPYFQTNPFTTFKMELNHQTPGWTCCQSRTCCKVLAMLWDGSANIGI